FLYLIAHIDSKPFVKGAIDNALSVALILMIAKEIRDTYSFPYRIRFLITDCEEMGLEGAKHHVENLKHTYYAIAVDSVGWVNPAVLSQRQRGLQRGEDNGKVLQAPEGFEDRHTLQGEQEGKKRSHTL
ncbi:MAG: M28 family peptidase, partial [Aquificota bacterium]|nr:M28 family peptidase [Aquificota bacterium]